MNQLKFKGILVKCRKLLSDCRPIAHKNTFSKVVLFAGLCGVSIPQSVMAQDQTHLLNQIKALDLDIYYQGEKGKWCAPRLDLVLKTSKPLIFFDDKFVKSQMSSLAERLNKSCPALSQLGVVGYSRSEPNVTQLEASYVAKDDWVHSTLLLPERLAQPRANVDANRANPENQPSLTAEANVPAQNRKLSFDEAKELQRRLAFLGFPSGKIDGKPGRKTAAAIRSFLRSQGVGIPARPDLDVLNLVRKVAGANTETGPQRTKADDDQNLVSLSKFVDVEDPTAFDTVTYMTLRSFHDMPNLLQNDQLVLSAITRLSKLKTSTLRADTTLLVRRYQAGTTFDRKDVLVEARNLFAREISAKASALKNPLNMLIRNDIRIDQSKYQAGRGFPFYSENRGLFRVKNNQNYAFYLFPLESSFRVSFEVSGFNLIVPILEESKARQLAALARNRRYQFQLQHYLTTTGPIKLNETRNPDYLINTSTRAVRLVMIDTESTEQKERLVYKWSVAKSTSQPTAEAAPKGNIDAKTFARWAGIGLLRNQHLILEKPVNQQSSFGEGSEAWARYEDIMSINRDPSLIVEEASKKRLARTFLTLSELEYLTDGKPKLLTMSDRSDYRSFDEFTRREFIERFARLDLKKAVKRYRPKLPIPVVQIEPASLGEYDFEGQRFPISYGERNNTQTVEAGFPLKSVSFHTLQRYPRWLPLSKKDAQFLVREFFPKLNIKKQIYLGIFSTLEPQPGSEPNDDLVQATTLRLALYLDRNLTKKIWEVPLSGLTQAAPGEFLVTAQERKKAQDALNLVPATSLQIAKAAENLEGADTFLDQYVRTTRTYRSASELDKPAVEQRLADVLKAEPYDQKEFWIHGTVDLQNYDPARQRFSMRSFKVEKDNAAGLKGNLIVSFSNSKDLRYLPADPDRARKAIRYSRNDGRGRTVATRMLVKPISAKILGRGGDGYRNLDLAFEVQKLVVIYKPRPGSSLAPFIVGEQTKGSFAREQSKNPGLLQANTILEVPIATDKQMVVAVSELNETPGSIAQAFVKSSRSFKNTNEIDAPEALRQGVETLRNEHRPGDTYWLGGQIELGGYDTQTQRFNVKSIGASYLQSKDENYDTSFELGLSNLFDFSHLELPVDQARNLLRRRGSNRKFDLRMLVRPTDVSLKDNENWRGPTLDIRHDVQELHIIDTKPSENGKSEAYVLASLRPTDATLPQTHAEPKAEASTQPTSDRPPLLTQDMLFAHSVKNFQGILSNQQLRWLAAQQWLSDNKGHSGLAENYFKAGSKISTQAVADLQNWYRNEDITIPKRLTIKWQIGRENLVLKEIDESDKSLSISPTTDTAKRLACNFLIHNPTPPDKYIGKGLFPLYFQRYSALQCGAPEVKFLENGIKQDSVTWLPRISLLLDEKPSLETINSDVNFAELEVEVTSIDVEPNAAGLPNIYIIASLQKADYAKWSLHRGEQTPRKKPLGTVKRKVPDGEAEYEPHSVVGIELGQSLKAAEEKIRKRIGANLIAYDTHPAPMIDQPPFQFAKVFMRADGTEKIVVYHEPDSPDPDRVLAIHRTWHAANNEAVNGPAIFAAAQRKFGKPDVMNEHSGLTLAWGRGTKGSDASSTDYVCVLGDNSLFPSVWKDKSGNVANVFDLPQWQQTGRQLRLSHGPGMTNYSDDGLREHYARCGPYLLINFQNSERLLDSKLVDTPKYVEAFLAAREKRKSAIETAVGTEKEFDL